MGKKCKNQKKSKKMNKKIQKNLEKTTHCLMLADILMQEEIKNTEKMIAEMEAFLNE